MHTWAYMLNCERPPTIESFLYLRVSAEAHALLKGLQGSGLHVDNNGPRVTVRTAVEKPTRRKFQPWLCFSLAIDLASKMNDANVDFVTTFKRF